MSLNVYKVGADDYYSKSLQKEHESYKLFPQREVWLMEHFKNIKVSHSNLEEMKDCDTVWVDNPLFFDDFIVEYDKPVIFDAIDWYLEMVIKEARFETIGRILRGFERLKKCKKLLLISQSPLIERYFEDVVGLKPLVKKMIPNGYDFELHTFSPFYVEHVPFSVLFFAGKLGRWYSNLAYFIEYVKHHPKWTLLIAGDGELKNYFEMVAEHSPNIKFLGFIPREEVAKNIKGSDICVFPVDDCSPIAVSEYMACGKPVVNLGMRLEWLVSLGEGACIESPASIGTALDHCVAHYSTLRVAARKKIEPYSWERNAIRFEEGAKELLGKC